MAEPKVKIMPCMAQRLWIRFVLCRGLTWLGTEMPWHSCDVTPAWLTVIILMPITRCCDITTGFGCIMHQLAIGYMNGTMPCAEYCLDNPTAIQNPVESCYNPVEYHNMVYVRSLFLHWRSTANLLEIIFVFGRCLCRLPATTPIKSTDLCKKGVTLVR